MELLPRLMAAGQIRTQFSDSGTSSGDLLLSVLGLTGEQEQQRTTEVSQQQEVNEVPGGGVSVSLDPDQDLLLLIPPSVLSSEA